MRFKKGVALFHVYDVSAEEAAKKQGTRLPRQDENQIGAQRASPPPPQGQKNAFRLTGYAAAAAASSIRSAQSRLTRLCFSGGEH
jgi:hypothetical protein